MKKQLLLFPFFILACCSTANAQYTKLLDFTGPNGANPQGNLYYDGTFLYGMTAAGGANNDGVAFRILASGPYGNGYVDFLDFDGAAHGEFPHGSFISDGTYLYGETQYGGSNNDGTVFRILLNGTGYFRMYDFDGLQNGKAPFGSLYYDGTYLYGMPQIGGANNLGTVFKILPGGAYANGYQKLFDFNGVGVNAGDAGEPEATLISDGTYLYAMGYNGGANNLGSAFRFLPNGNGYSDLMDCANSSNGEYPTNALVSDGTHLYGMTESGGTSGLGTIFRMDLNGTNYFKMLDFNGTNGAVPHGGLYFDGTYLYGAASGGGANSDGLIFKILPSGAYGNGYQDIYDFAGATTGRAPRGDLISDGTYLYGMTTHGGTNDDGVVFKFQYCTPPTVTLNLASIDTECVSMSTVALVGGNPAGGTFSGTAVVGNNFSPSAAGVGTFAITYTYTDVNGCSSSAVDSIHVDICLGMTVNTKNNDIDLFPNPSSNSITLQSSTELGMVVICNSLGEIIYNEKINSTEQQIDLSKFPDGIYFLSTQGKKMKLIKE